MPVFKTGAIGHSATSPMDVCCIADGDAVDRRREFSGSDWQRQRPCAVRPSDEYGGVEVREILEFFRDLFEAGRGLRGRMFCSLLRRLPHR